MSKHVLLAAIGSLILAAGPVLAQGHGGGGHGGGGHGGGGGHASGGHSGGGGPFRLGGSLCGRRRPRLRGLQRRPSRLRRQSWRVWRLSRRVWRLSRRVWRLSRRVWRLSRRVWRLSRGATRHGYGGYHGGYHGYSTGAYWRGGYWHGGYWPRAYYGWGYAWFLPVLPLAYATYWYGGAPYYYANDVYYTWSPSYDGYVATDPPPVADPSGAAAAAAPDQSSGGAPQGYPADGGQVPTSGNSANYPPASYPPTGDPAAGQQQRLFMYPKNGQSQEQQSIDRRECQQWAAQQAGQGAANGSDYQRAMVACVEGRGYSAS